MICYVLERVCLYLVSGSHFISALNLAYQMRAKHQTIALEYTQTFPAEKTRVWQEDINKWNKDFDHKPDPYEEVFARKHFLVLQTWF